MNIEEYSEKNKTIEKSLLDFLENEASTDEDFRIITDIIDKNKIFSDKYELILFLHLISKISEYHHRGANLINKLEQIIRNYENDIKKNLTNFEIFNIFKDSKRLLLFLFEEKILIINKQIVKKLTTKKYIEANYPQYFSPEFKPFIEKELFPEYDEYGYELQENKWANDLYKELPENFNELRKSGENDSYICKLIRNDSIDEFVVYITKNNYPLQSSICQSIYETNSFLIKKQIESDSDDNLTLIQYAAFFGAIQILRFLQMNEVDLNPELLIFATCGKNPTLIHHLEANAKIESESDDNSNQNLEQNPYIKCLEQSIRCHHNDIANYFLDNYFQLEDIKSKFILKQSLKSYNFSFVQNELINENSLLYLCQYDYCQLVYILLNHYNVDVNKIYENSSIKFNKIFE